MLSRNYLCYQIEQTILSMLKGMGYVKFQPKETYLKSMMHYTRASFQDKETDPTIFIIESADGDHIKVWSNIYNEISIGPSETEEIIFNSNLYINNERFVVHYKPEEYRRLFSFKPKNVFQRPVIRGIDDRYDLGNIIFIVSDNGILYSLYSHPKHLTVDENTNVINLLTEHNKDIEYSKNITFEIYEKVIGSYGNPFKINCVHVFPKGNFFNSRTYDDWEI